MKILKWLDDNFELFLVAISLCALVAIMAVQVFMRYVLNASLSWPEELSRYLFIWLSFIGISYATKKDLHLKIDILLEYVNKKTKMLLSILRDISMFIFSIFMLVGGIAVFQNTSGSLQVSPALGLPFQFVYLALPIGFGLCLFRIIQKYVLLLSQLKGSEKS